MTSCKDVSADIKKNS